MKKTIVILSLLLSLALLFSACGVTDAPETPSADETASAPVLSDVNVGFLQGPTGMGAAYLMQQNAGGVSALPYNVQTGSDPTSFTASLINGELDIAALPVNAAATLYAKTGGKVQILAVNTLGVMYILDASGTVNGITDLKGKTVLSAGQGSSPEYILNYLLTENGLTPGEDVIVEYASEHAEVVAQALAGKYDAVLLPEPFVTKLRQKNDAFRVAVDLTEEWEKLGKGELLTGCMVVRTQFAEEHPEEVKAFLADYETSVNYALRNGAEAAALMGSFGIIDEETALLALPNCNITFMAGEEMKENTAAYLGVLAEADPASVGGEIPGDDFYYPADTASEAK